MSDSRHRYCRPIYGRHLNNHDFISKIKDFDLISLVETWLPYGNQKINIDGYYSYSKHRKEKAQNARRNSGGITILVKSSLKKGIKFLDRESNEEFVWWKLEKLIGQFTCNTYNGASVVDYVIVSQDLFPFVQSFSVHNPTELTHHSC